MHCYPNHTRLMLFNLILDIQIIYASCISLLILDIFALCNVKKNMGQPSPSRFFFQIKRGECSTYWNFLRRLFKFMNLTYIYIEDIIEIFDIDYLK